MADASKAAEEAAKAVEQQKPEAEQETPSTGRQKKYRGGPIPRSDDEDPSS